MCVFRETTGGSVLGSLLCTLGVVATVSIVVLLGNAGIMLWRDGQVTNLWRASLGDIGFVLMLTVPIIPAGGVYAKRRRCL